jgi:hypothetical protein
MSTSDSDHSERADASAMDFQEEIVNPSDSNSPKSSSKKSSLKTNRESAESIDSEETQKPMEGSHEMWNQSSDYGLPNGHTNNRSGPPPGNHNTHNANNSNTGNNTRGGPRLLPNVAQSKSGGFGTPSDVKSSADESRSKSQLPAHHRHTWVPGPGGRSRKTAANIATRNSLAEVAQCEVG